VTNSLVNIRAITAHFCPKIDAWLSSQQVRSVFVRKNALFESRFAQFLFEKKLFESPFRLTEM
jgi:hypothetical protein